MCSFVSLCFLFRILAILVLHIHVIRAFSVVCHRDKEGAWALGMVTGPNPFQMKPLMSKITIGGSEQSCYENPVLTCADASEVNATFMADPFMFFPNGTDGAWYVFFEMKLLGQHGVVGVAESLNKVCFWFHLFSRCPLIALCRAILGNI
jgi:hypothetical protein